MKYYDNQPARKGDTLIIATIATCVIEAIDKHEHVATVRNTKNGEVYEMKSLNEAVLLTRGVIIDSAEAYARIAELEAALKDVLYGGPGEGYVSSSEPDSFESRCNRAEEILNATI